MSCMGEELGQLGGNRAVSPFFFPLQRIVVEGRNMERNLTSSQAFSMRRVVTRIVCGELVSSIVVKTSIVSSDGHAGLATREQVKTG